MAETRSDKLQDEVARLRVALVAYYNQHNDPAYVISGRCECSRCAQARVALGLPAYIADRRVAQRRKNLPGAGRVGISRVATRDRRAAE